MAERLAVFSNETGRVTGSEWFTRPQTFGTVERFVVTNASHEPQEVTFLHAGVPTRFTIPPLGRVAAELSATEIAAVLMQNPRLTPTNEKLFWVLQPPNF